MQLMNAAKHNRTVMPTNLQMLGLKLCFIDCVIDEYYSNYLICEALRLDSLRDLSIEVMQLSQLKFFAFTLNQLQKITPLLMSLSLRNMGHDSNLEVNQDYFPLEHFPEGLQNLRRIKLHKIPLRNVQFKGLLGNLHSNSPNLLELELIDNFNVQLLDLREYLV
jgi:hypothetical protein